MNKKHLFPILGLILLMVGCKGEDENTVKFETVTADKTVALTNEENSPACTMHLKMETATKESGHVGELINTTVMERLLDREETSMNLAVEAFIDSYIRSYQNTMLPLYNEDRADTTKRAWYQYHYVIETSTQPGSKGTIVYLATIDYYEGGAHGINQLLTLNFETKTGRQLTLADIFVNGYEQPLKNILLKSLKTKTDCSTMNALRDKGYLRTMDIFPSENFILGEETITFIYNPYEIAPYDMGSTELIVPYSDLKDILKNSFDY